MPRTIPFDLLTEDTHNLRFNTNAFAALEERIGLGPAEIFNEKRIGLGLIRSLVWAGLLHEMPKLKIETVGDWIDRYMEVTEGETQEKLTKLFGPLQEAMEASSLFSERRPPNGVGGQAKPAVAIPDLQNDSPTGSQTPQS